MVLVFPHKRSSLCRHGWSDACNRDGDWGLAFVEKAWSCSSSFVSTADLSSYPGPAHRGCRRVWLLGGARLIQAPPNRRVITIAGSMTAPNPIVSLISVSTPLQALGVKTTSPRIISMRRHKHEQRAFERVPRTSSVIHSCIRTNLLTYWLIHQ